MKIKRMFIGIIILTFFSCYDALEEVYDEVGQKVINAGIAKWARSVMAGSGVSCFNGVSVDSSGNVYAAGSQYGTGTYTYGTGVSATGDSTVNNVLLVKYNNSGTAQWARTVSAGSGYSGFVGVSVDSSGDVYAAGYQISTGTYTYGTGVSATGTSTNDNVVLVKYSRTGTALWARTVSTGSSDSHFNSVAVDSSGNIYAAGFQRGTGTYTYGTGVTATGISTDQNVVLVKYNSSGTAQWARSVTSGTSRSCFRSICVDSSGNVYAAGYQAGTGSHVYGSGVSATSPYFGDNVVIVKYDNNGTALWARTVTAGTDYGVFNGVSVDSSGNVYATGYQSGTGTYIYGTGVSATGTGSATVVLVKYNSSGTAQWARTVSAGSNSSKFNGVSVDSSGNVYAAGYQENTGTYTYGTGVSAAGTSTLNNVVLVKYNSSGTALWARTVSLGGNESSFKGVSVDSSGNAYAAGYQYGTGTFTYGTGVSTAGAYASGYNALLVKYSE